MAKDLSQQISEAQNYGDLAKLSGQLLDEVGKGGLLINESTLSEGLGDLIKESAQSGDKDPHTKQKWQGFLEE